MAAKVIYFYDPKTRVLDHSQLIDSEVALPDNSTDVRPADGLYTPITLNADGLAWSGVTREEWLAAQPAQPAPTPTAEQQMINALGLQIGQLTAELAAQKNGGAE